jgi:hypothetical protein
VRPAKHSRKINPARTIDECGRSGKASNELLCDVGLAHASRTRQREQALGYDLGRDLGERRITTDERVVEGGQPS